MQCGVHAARASHAACCPVPPHTRQTRIDCRLSMAARSNGRRRGPHSEDAPLATRRVFFSPPPAPPSSCLARWLTASAAAGKPRSARRKCELCGGKWRCTPRDADAPRCGLGRAARAAAGGLLAALRRAVVAARADPAEAMLNAYCGGLVARGAVAAARGAAVGARAGGRLGAASARRAAAAADFLPEAALAGWAFPALAPALAAAARCASAAAALELALPAAAGAYVGALAAFGGRVGGDAAAHARGLGRLARAVGRGVVGVSRR